MRAHTQRLDRDLKFRLQLYQDAFKCCTNRTGIERVRNTNVKAGIPLVKWNSLRERAECDCSKGNDFGKRKHVSESVEVKKERGVWLECRKKEKRRERMMAPKPMKT
jgi:hypothetical protein